MDVDATHLGVAIARLKRAQGQLGGVIRMIEEGRDCAEVLTQLSAASHALSRAGFAVLSTSLRQCETSDDESVRSGEWEKLERLFLSLA